MFFGETFIPLTPEDINPLKEDIKKALEEGLTETTFNGKTIPINDDTLKAVQAIEGIVKPTGTGGEKPKDPSQPEVLLIKENFDDLTFEKQLQKTKALRKSLCNKQNFIRFNAPSGKSLNWQIDAYLAGIPEF